MCPQHLNGKRTAVRLAAFRSPPGKDEVSVIRHRYRGTDFCKLKGKQAAAKNENKNVSYAGLAVVTVRQILDSSAKIADSRRVFCGHADISYGIIRPRDEPFDSATNLKLDEIIRKLVSVTVYYPDPDPNSAWWTGPHL